MSDSSDIVKSSGEYIDVPGPFTVETWVAIPRWKHRMIEAMCDRFHQENGDEPDARGDSENRGGSHSEGSEAGGAGSTEGETC